MIWKSDVMTVLADSGISEIYVSSCHEMHFYLVIPSEYFYLWYYK